MADPVWVDTVTPLNAVNMTKLQTRDERATVNGYASLGADGKVPAAQLPAAVDLSPYQTKAEKAVANGYASLDSLGKVPTTQLPSIAVAYGTSLPGSPVDGQEAVLVDSTTAPTYAWRFRYNAGSTSAYKWEFIGGAPARHTIMAGEAGASGAAFHDLTTPGPLFTIPRAGDYDVEFGAEVFNNGAAGAGGSIYIPALNPYGGCPTARVLPVPLSGAYWFMTSAYQRFVAVPAATVAKVQYNENANMLLTYASRFLRVAPFRVS